MKLPPYAHTKFHGCLGVLSMVRSNHQRRLRDGEFSDDTALLCRSSNPPAKYQAHSMKANPRPPSVRGRNQFFVDDLRTSEKPATTASVLYFQGSVPSYRLSHWREPIAPGSQPIYNPSAITPDQLHSRLASIRSPVYNNSVVNNSVVNEYDDVYPGDSSGYASKVLVTPSKTKWIKWIMLVLILCVFLAAAVLIPIYFLVIKPKLNQTGGAADTIGPRYGSENAISC